MTDIQINKLYDTCIKFPNIMNENCYMNEDLADVVEYAAEILGYKIKCYQRGLFQAGNYVFWHNQYREYTDTIIQWKTKVGSHFTQGDKHKIEIFDPWQGGISKLYKQRILLYEVIV